MKKASKKILIYVAILYFIFSLCYSMYLKGAYTEQLHAVESSNESMIIIENIGKNKDERLAEYYSKIEIIDMNLISMSIAVIIGGIIGLIMSVKENSKIKYILYFIFGNIIFNITWTVIQIVIHNSINTFANLSFIRTYINTTLKTLIPYIIMYLLILYANMLNNKQKVKNLNATLNNEKVKREFKVNKKAIIIIATILVIIIVILIGMLARRTIILVKYSKAINELVSTENYYIKTIQQFKSLEEGKIVNTEEYMSEFYYKNEITIEKQYRDTEYKSTIYKDKKDMIIINKDYTILQEREDDFERKGIYNYYYGDTYPRFWQNIELACTVNIKKVEYNGRACYKIERKDNDIVYIDSKTYEPVGVTNITNYTRTGIREDEIKCKTIVEETYTIKKDIVKDEDIVRPNLEGVKTYTIEELNERYNKK